MADIYRAARLILRLWVVAVMDVEQIAGDTFPFPKHGITCFHCGETFTTPGGAKNHFGFEPSADPACRIKLGAERGLVMALRKAEAEIAHLQGLLEAESCEAYRLLASTHSRHREQIMDAEELGYARGLTDGRAHHITERGA